MQTTDRRQFTVHLECDGIPYRYTASVVDQAEACRRARDAFSQQPGVTYQRMRVVACIERERMLCAWSTHTTGNGPRTAGRADQHQEAQ